MSDVLDRPLHGVAIYNPRLLSKEELIGFFVARHEELARLTSALRREAKAQPQHHLVVGARGMGKTTLLNRLRYVIEDDEELASRCFALVFPEEQYNVVCLADFWLNCVDALADGLESAGRLELLEGLDEEIVRIQALPRRDDRGRQALGLLCRLSDRLKRRLMLLVDNVDLVLDRIDDEQWGLREVLSSESRIQLVGATSAPLESHYRHDKAFYDFFRVHHLEGLDDEQTLTVLRRMAEETGQERVIRLIDEEPGRVKAVRLMAGGNPRTVVMLFSVLAQGTEGDVRTDIERLLDQCTPLYKHRLEVLPMQAQQVLDGLAKHWAPATAAEVAAATHLQVNAVSSQLDRLVKDGTVEKVSLPDTKRQGFQIAERFFNIWCLMRASRRVRRRLVWLVEFLRLIFGAEDLVERARRHLEKEQPQDALRHAELGLALADVVGNDPLRNALELSSIRALCIDPALRGRLAELFDLGGQDEHLASKAERLSLLARAHANVMSARIYPLDYPRDVAWDFLGRAPRLSPHQKERLSRIFQDTEPDVDRTLIFALGIAHHHIYSEALDPEGYETLTHALKDGYVALEQPTKSELEAARLSLEAPSLGAWVLSMAAHLGHPVDFQWFTAEVQSSHSLFPWLEWARLALASGISKHDVVGAIHPVLEAPHQQRLGWIFIADFLLDHPELSRDPTFARIQRLTEVECMVLATGALSLLVAHHDWARASKWLRISIPEVRIDVQCALLLQFIRAAAAKGLTTEARELLATIGAPDERWEPLALALEVLERGNESSLERLAPEMREAVRLVLSHLSPQAPEEPAPPPPKRRRATTRRS